MASQNASNLVSFGPHANCTFALCAVEDSVYGYRPSLGANLAFMILFSVAMVAHTIVGTRWRTWWFLGCMVLGCSSEIVGYAGRVMLFYNPWTFVGFMIQIVCLATAPVYFTAAIYVTLAKA